MDRRINIGCTALAVACVVGAASADPIVTSFPAGDAGYSALTNGGQLEQGTAEGRIGNRINLGAWELALWRRVEVGPFLNLAQLAWGNGQAAPFTITYDGATSLTYNIGSLTIATSQMGGTFSDIFIRLRAGKSSSVSLSSMRFVGGAIIGGMLAQQDGQTEYLRISNGETAFPAFTLTGFQTLMWNVNDPPVNSQLGAQFRMANVVPAPGTAFALLATAPVFLRRRRR